MALHHIPATPYRRRALVVRILSGGDKLHYYAMRPHSLLLKLFVPAMLLGRFIRLESVRGHYARWHRLRFGKHLNGSCVSVTSAQRGVGTNYALLAQVLFPEVSPEGAEAIGYNSACRCEMSFMNG